MKRYSQKREAILTCLRSTDCHPSAEWVYRRLKPDYPDLSLATVYRNLAAFVEEGAIATLGTVNGRERFDGDVSPHSHFICQRCGRIVDVALPATKRLDRTVKELTGGVVLHRSLTLRGLCGECLEENTQGQAPCI